MELLAGFIFGLLVAAIGAWCTVYFQRYSLKQQNTLNLSERYNSSDFQVMRSVVWEIKAAWGNGDRSIINHFLNWTTPDAIEGQYQRCSNGLWPHQNLSALLHFFGNLARYYDAGLVDKKLLQALFAPQYFWYKEFIDEFVDAYQVQKREQNLPPPQWVTALARLDAILAEYEDA